MNYQQKYLKYKSKYLYLKNQQEGGSLATTVVKLALPQIALAKTIAAHTPAEKLAHAALAAAAGKLTPVALAATVGKLPRH